MRKCASVRHIRAGRLGIVKIMARREFNDLSFMMQALDNTRTFTEVHPRVAKDWRKRGPLTDDDVMEYLAQEIVDLQLYGKPSQFGQPGDRIIIHRDDRSFVAQIHVDARDEANRPVTVLCFGYLPRDLRDGVDHYGMKLLQDFLERHQIPWNDRIQKRYVAVCRELSKPSGFGAHIIDNLRSRIGGIPEDTHTVRLRPHPRRHEAESSAAADTATSSPTADVADANDDVLPSDDTQADANSTQKDSITPKQPPEVPPAGSLPSEPTE